MKLSAPSSERYETTFQIYLEGASGAGGGKTGGLWLQLNETCFLSLSFVIVRNNIRPTRLYGSLQEESAWKRRTRIPRQLLLEGRRRKRILFLSSNNVTEEQTIHFFVANNRFYIEETEVVNGVTKARKSVFLRQ